LSPGEEESPRGTFGLDFLLLVIFVVFIIRE
jgi:hypothetical protein